MAECSLRCGRLPRRAMLCPHSCPLAQEGYLKNEIDIFKVTDRFRRCRQAIIQTKEQYFYAYKSVLDLIESIKTQLPGMIANGAIGGAAPPLPVKLASQNPFAPAPMSADAAPNVYENYQIGGKFEPLCTLD